MMKIVSTPDFRWQVKKDGVPVATTDSYVKAERLAQALEAQALSEVEPQ